MFSLEKSQLEGAYLMAFIWMFFNKETDKGESDLLWLMQAADDNDRFYEKFYGYMNIFKSLDIKCFGFF